MRFLTLGEVLRLHADLIAVSGGASGVRDLARVESALAQPLATFDGAELSWQLSRRTSQALAMESPDQSSHHFEMMARFHAQLSELPAQLLEHHYSLASFGSWWSVIRYRGVPFRIVFDGRDRALVIERSEAATPPYVWGAVVWRQAPSTEQDLLGSRLPAAIRASASAG